MLKTIIYTIFWVINLHISSEDIEVETNSYIYSLNSKNFDYFINKHKYVFVIFHEPWCGKFKKNYSIFSDIARKMSLKYDIFVANLDVYDSSNKSIVNKYKLDSELKMIFFKEKYPIEYSDKIDSQDITKFLLRNQLFVVNLINSIEDFNSLKLKNKIFIIYFGNNLAYLNKLNSIAISYDKIKYYQVSNDELINGLKYDNNSIIVYKDNGKIEKKFKKQLATEELEKFIYYNSYEGLLKLDKDNNKYINNNLNLLFILDNENSKYEADLIELSKIYSDNLIFSKLENNSDYGKHFKKILNLADKDIPSIFILDNKNKKFINKYKFDGKIKKKNLENFIKKYFQNKLKNFYKSQDIPEYIDNNEPLELVGKNFEEVVINSNKHFLVNGYSPGCVHSGKLNPGYIKIHKILKDHPFIKIAKMNLVLNEHPKFKYKSYPTILLYKKGSKSKPIKFEDSPTVENILKFLEMHANLKYNKKSRLEL